jgi:hypothetical protein
MLTFKNELLDMIKLKHICLNSNLLCFIQDFYHSLLHLLILALIFISWISSRKKNPLQFIIFYNVFIIFYFLNSFKILVTLEEKVSFINNQAFQEGKINWLSTLNEQLNLSMSRYNNLRRFIFSIEVWNSDPCTFE